MNPKEKPILPQKACYLCFYCDCLFLTRVVMFQNLLCGNNIFVASDALPHENRFSVPTSSDSRSSSPGIICNLPGPSQVITHPGQSGTNAVTGERQRRRGVSGPPSGR